VLGVVGRGKHRKILLPVSTGQTSPAISAPHEMDEGDGDGEEPPPAPAPPNAEAAPLRIPSGPEAMSLEYGMHCARNALFLSAPAPAPPAAAAPAPAAASAGSGGSAKGAAVKPAPNAKDTSPSPEVVTRNAEAEAECQQVQVGALLHLSYLALCVSSPELALSYAEQLLKVPDADRSSKLQAHMYAAEALCILNRPQEAALHVSATVVGELLLDPPQPEPKASSGEAEEAPVIVNHPVHLYCSDSGELAPATHRCHLYVNMASVFVTQNELSKAEKCCQQALLAAPHDNHALQLHVYLELRTGRIDGALKTLISRRAMPAMTPH